MTSIKKRLPRLKLRRTQNPRRPRLPNSSLPLTSPQAVPRSSQQSVSHMDQERKLKRKQFPYRPQSNFCFLQSRATCRIISGPPQAREELETIREGPGGTRELGD